MEKKLLRLVDVTVEFVGRDMHANYFEADNGDEYKVENGTDYVYFRGADGEDWYYVDDLNIS